MLNDIPPEDLPEGEQEAKFWKSVADELATMIGYASRATEPEIVLSDFRKGGTQYLWEFCVNDLSMTRKGEYNFHGQNTSQWQYAGAICLENGRVSTHH